MSRTLGVAMDEILEAMTMSQDLGQWVLDLETGGVELIAMDSDGDDDLAAAYEADPDRYAEIPTFAGNEEFGLMRAFADEVDEEDLAAKLAIALGGKGSFSRFRDIVFQYPDLKTRWLTRKREVLLERAKEWLETLGIDPVFELPPIEPAPPARQEPRARVTPPISASRGATAISRASRRSMSSERT